MTFKYAMPYFCTMSDIEDEMIHISSFVVKICWIIISRS